MQFQVKGTVIGVNANKGKMDNGTEFDFCRVFVLNELTGSGKLGFAQSEYNYGVAANIDKFSGQTFPFEAEMICEMTTTGKIQKVEIVKLKPVSVTPTPKAS